MAAQNSALFPWSRWASVIREERLARGESQAGFARAIGLNVVYWSHLESGARVGDAHRIIPIIARHWQVDEEKLAISCGLLPQDVVDRLAQNPGLVAAIREAG